MVFNDKTPCSLICRLNVDVRVFLCLRKWECALYLSIFIEASMKASKLLGLQTLTLGGFLWNLSSDLSFDGARILAGYVYWQDTSIASFIRKRMRRCHTQYIVFAHMFQDMMVDGVRTQSSTRNTYILSFSPTLSYGSWQSSGTFP